MAAINDLINQIQDPALRAKIEQEVDKLTKQKKFGLVFEEHLPECTPLYDIPVRKGLKVSVRDGKANEIYIVLKVADGKAVCLPKDGTKAVEFDVADLVTTAELGDPIYPYLQPLGEVCNAPDSDLWHTLIEADNYHALQLLEYLYAGKVDCIYIDPPYNTGAKDWKYNNDYVDGADEYRHSKWLSFMQKRLELAKKLLNPNDSVLIVTIDEKEYLHLGCLLEDMFPSARMQMISTVISRQGATRQMQFGRVDEYIYILEFGNCAVQGLDLSDEWRMNANDSRTLRLLWQPLLRGAKNGRRQYSPGCFYPIYISEDGNRFVEIGDAIPLNVDRRDIPDKEGAIMAGKAVGKFIGSVPLIKKGSVDEFLQSSGERLRKNAVEMEKEAVHHFATINDPGTGVLMDKMEDMIQIYNHTTQICFDKEKIYLVSDEPA